MQTLSIVALETRDSMYEVILFITTPRNAKITALNKKEIMNDHVL
jgi:hypothetical protein